MLPNKTVSLPEIEENIFFVRKQKIQSEKYIGSFQMKMQDGLGCLMLVQGQCILLHQTPTTN